VLELSRHYAEDVLPNESVNTIHRKACLAVDVPGLGAAPECQIWGSRRPLQEWLDPDDTLHERRAAVRAFWMSLIKAYAEEGRTDTVLKALEHL